MKPGEKRYNLKNKKIKFIACKVIYDEVRDSIPERWDVVYFKKGLHERSDILRKKLQNEIDRSQDYDFILLGYGFCGRGTEGLVSERTVLVIPRCHDCIAMLLGSVEEYKAQFSREPGTYYLTRGHIGDIEDFRIGRFLETEKKYDRETADWVIGSMLKNYKRLVFINTGNYNSEKWLKRAGKEARRLRLKFEEIRATDKFLMKMLEGKWDRNFLILKPGRKVTPDMFTGD